MTTNEAIESLKNLISDTEDAKQIISEYLQKREDERFEGAMVDLYLQEYENKRKQFEDAITALQMGIGALELCEKAKERS